MKEDDIIRDFMKSKSSETGVYSLTKLYSSKKDHFMVKISDIK